MAVSDALARKLEKQLGVDLDAEGITLAQFKRGITEELEHVPTIRRIQKINVNCKVSNADIKYISASIAYDHLIDIPDYYTRLARMEKEAKREMAHAKR